MGKRTTTLRNLLLLCIKETLKDEGMLRSEQYQLVEHILNNSSLKLSADYIKLTNGNFIGVGESNKDKTLTFPRFLSFSFGFRDIFQTLENQERTWELKSYDTLKELEESLLYQEERTKMVALINGEIVGYEIQEGKATDDFGSWYSTITWESAVYRVSYVLDDEEIEEKFYNKHSLELFLKDIIRKRAKEIEVYNIIEEKYEGFSVNAVIYDTNDINADGCWLTWQRHKSEIEEENEEEEELAF